jgi:hypothetical protein
MLRDKSAAPALDPSFLRSAHSPISGTVHDEIILEETTIQADNAYLGRVHR